MIKDILAQSAAVKQKLADQCAQQAEQAAQKLASCLQSGGKLMLCGNGGSAADAQHLAAEFVATLDHRYPRAGLPALALTTDTSFLTAYSNDFGFEGVFARQVETLGRSGDMLFAISTSGNSKNIIAAVKTAQKQGIFVVGLTGWDGGKCAAYCDILINVPSNTTMHIQECHIALGHAITARVEQLMAQAQQK